MAYSRPESEIESGCSALKVTLLADEWGSSKGGLSTINRELAKQLAKLPNVEVTFFLPKCSEKDKNAAKDLGITIKEADERPGYEPIHWLAFPPRSLSIDVVVGHGVKLGPQAQIIRDTHKCKWVQVVHTAPEELAMYKVSSEAVHRGEEKHQAEIELCEIADFVVAIGPKLADNFSAYLSACPKEVFNFTPGVFDEFSHVEQGPKEGETFRVLVFGRGDPEDFELKGYDIAAQAVATLNDSKYRLIFLGAPNGKEDEVKNNLLKHKISRSQLIVRGFRESRENLCKLLCEANLAIMPSRTEGFGLAGVEALSAGLPILVSGNSGFAEALRKVPLGSDCVVDSEDANAWAKAIKKVREKDRQIRLQESKILRSHYAERYDWQKQCKELVKSLRSTNQDFPEGGLDVSRGAHSASGDSSGRGSLPRHDAEASSGSGDFAGEQNVHSTGTRMHSLPQNSAQAQKRPKPTGDNQIVKEGTPSDEELELLSREIGDKWKPLGRRLRFTDAELTGFHKDNEEYFSKAYQMLIGWKQRDHPGPSGYRVLYEALSHKFVGRKDLAVEFCCV